MAEQVVQKKKHEKKRRSSILKSQNPADATATLVAPQDTITKRISASRRVSFAETRVVKEFDNQGLNNKSPHHEPAYQDSMSSNEASHRAESKMSFTQCLSGQVQVMQQSNYAPESMQETNLSSGLQQTNLCVESMEQTKLDGVCSQSNYAQESMQISRVISPALADDTGKFLANLGAASTPLLKMHRRSDNDSEQILDKYGLEAESGEEEMELDDDETTNVRQLLQESLSAQQVANIQREQSSEAMDITKAVSRVESPAPVPSMNSMSMDATEQTDNFLAQLAAAKAQADAHSTKLGGSMNVDVSLETGQGIQAQEQMMTSPKKEELMPAQSVSATPSPAIQSKRRRISNSPAAKVEEKPAIDDTGAGESDNDTEDDEDNVIPETEYEDTAPGVQVTYATDDSGDEMMQKHQADAEYKTQFEDEQFEQTITNLRKKIRRSMDLSIRQVNSPMRQPAPEPEENLTRLDDISTYLMDSQLGESQNNEKEEQTMPDSELASADTTQATEIGKPDFDPELFNMHMFNPETHEDSNEAKTKLLDSCLGQYQKQIKQAAAEKLKRAIKRLESNVEEQLKKIKEENPKLESAIRNHNMAKFDPELRQLMETCERKAEAEWLQYRGKMTKTLKTAIKSELSSAQPDLEAVRKGRKLVQSLPQLREQLKQVGPELAALKEIDIEDVRLYAKRQKEIKEMEERKTQDDMELHKLRISLLRAQRESYKRIEEEVEMMKKLRKNEEKKEKKKEQEEKEFFKQVFADFK